MAELAFFVGNLLSWLAATSPAFPSDDWERYSKKKRPVAFDTSWHGLFLQKMPTTGANSKKEVGHRPFTQGYCGTPSLQARLADRLPQILAHIVKVQCQWSALALFTLLLWKRFYWKVKT